MSELSDLLAKADDLGAWQTALVREQYIRKIMARTGEGREPVTEMIDAMDSMDQEAILELTGGEPTTLKDALQRYVADLDEALEGSKIGVDGVINHLNAIMAYPWSGEEERIQLHNPHYGVALHINEGNDRDLEIRMGNNRWLIHTVNWEDAGSGGQRAAEEVARAVHRATLARVIADREHIVQLNGPQVRDLLDWLLRPNGSLSLDKRMSVNAAGNGVLIRTRPYAFQSDRELGGRS